MATPLWRQRNFMLLWGGQLGSWLGTEVSGIAVPLLVLALTGSPAQAGAVAGMRGLVYVFLAIPAGVVIDSADRKRVMFVANLGSGLAIGSIAVALALGRLTIPHLYLAVAVEGAFFVFANLGRFAAYTRIVPRAQYPAAAAQFGTADHLAQLGGPSLGGFLYGAGGGFLAFALDALSYIANACSILLIDAPLNAAGPQARMAVRQEIAEAFRWLRGQPLLRFLVLLSGGRTLIAAGLYLLVVVLAEERGAAGLAIGLIFTLAALGGLASSLVAARIHRRFTTAQLLRGTTFLSVVLFAAYATAANNAILAAITALFYAVDTLYTVTTSSYSATIIPDPLRGRVVSLTRLVSLGAHSGGFFLTGLLLSAAGSARTIAILAALLLVLFLATLTNKALARE
jgi:MFS family permease